VTLISVLFALSSERIGVSESMPSDVLCDADLSCCWTDNGSHEALPPITVFGHAQLGWRTANRRLPGTCVAAPRVQCLCRMRVKWNGLL
jgi:hypothetical protein